MSELVKGATPRYSYVDSTPPENVRSNYVRFYDNDDKCYFDGTIGDAAYGEIALVWNHEQGEKIAAALNALALADELAEAVVRFINEGQSYPLMIDSAKEALSA